MHAHGLCRLAVGQVQTKGPDRRSQPATDAIAVYGLEIVYAIRRVAGVDKCRDAPRHANPAHDLSARKGVIAAADGGVADARAKALKGITAHGRVASGAEQ